MTQFKFSDKYNDKDLSLTDGKFIYINKNNEVWAMVQENQIQKFQKIRGGGISPQKKQNT